MTELDLGDYDKDDKIETRFLDNVSYTLNDEFYENVRGVFNLSNLGGKIAIIDLEMDTPQAEIFVGLILNDMLTEEQITNVDSTLTDVSEYDHPLNLSIYKVYLENLKFINQTPDTNNKIINPSTSRKITVGKQSFNQIYKQIKLKDPEYRKLSSLDVCYYPIDDTKCVPSYIKYKISPNFDETTAKRILETDCKFNDGFTYEQVVKLFKHYKRSVKILDLEFNTLAEYKYKKQKHTLVYIRAGHLYILNSLNKHTYSKCILFEDSNDKTTNSTVIMTDIEQFNNLKITVSNYMTVGDDHSTIYYKNNKYVFNPRYVSDVNSLSKISKHLCKKSMSYNLALEKIFNLRGCMNIKTYNQFLKVDNIPIFNVCSTSYNVSFDINKAYPSVLRKRHTYGVPIYTDTIKPFKTLQAHGMYYAELTNYCPLFPRARFFNYQLINMLKKNSRLKKIIYEFIPTNRSTTPNIGKYEITNSRLRVYSGWLETKRNILATRYTYPTEQEIEAFDSKYKNISYENGKLTIFKQKRVPLTGIIAKLQIKDFVLCKLYEFHLKFMLDNPTAQIHKLNTDEIAYNVNGWKSNSLINNKPGFFKIKDDFEWMPQVPPKITLGPHIRPTPYIYKPVEQYTNVYELLDSRTSFSIFNAGGLGKTYTLNNSIIPYLKEHKLKYLLTSTTIANKDQINGDCTIQSLLKLNMYQLDTYLSNYKYIIVDEMSQCDQKTFKLLEYIKQTCNLILIGDDCQCASIDVKKSLLRNNFIYTLVNHNNLKLNYHKNARYTKQLYDLLETLRTPEYFNNKKLSYKYVLDNFETVNNDSKLSLTYTNKMKKKLNGFTVHSYQGKTISTPYTIYELDKMPTDVIYTALSRATSVNQICIGGLPHPVCD